MDNQKIDQSTILTELDDLAETITNFPYYNLKDKRQLKFGQYVSVIELNRKTILNKITQFQSHLTQYLAEIELRGVVE